MTNVVIEIKYTNHFPACTGATRVTTALYIIGMCYLAIMIAIEVAMIFRRRKLKFINQDCIPGGKEYFNRISNVNRKRWIAQELYWREHYGYYTISDRTLDALIRTKGKPSNFTNDPSNYEFLMN